MFILKHLPKLLFAVLLLMVCVGMGIGGLLISKRLLSLEGEGGRIYDIVLSGGRVIDPETGVDEVLNVGILGGKVVALTTNMLMGRKRLIAGGLVVSPGFINLNVHTMDNETYRLLAYDGVTAAFELEGGTADVDRFYKERRGKSYLHYGVSVGHAAVRMGVYRDDSFMIPVGDAATKIADTEELRLILGRIKRGLERGALGVGLTIAYTPGASRLEILEIFRLAKRYEGVLFVHLRQSGNKKS